MRRQATIVVAGGIALGLGASIVALTARLQSEQTHRRDLVDTALAEQRRAAQADRAPTPEAPSPAEQRLCVRGVDTFASASGADSVLDERGRLDSRALDWLSRQALRAQRRAELAHAGPSLPQRLGRTRTDGEWSVIEPPTRQCNESTAYAALSLESQRPTSTPSGAK